MVLRERLKAHREADAERWRGERPDGSVPRILFNESVVLATLTFGELLRGALPLTDWWQRVVAPTANVWSKAALRKVAEDLNTFKPGVKLALPTDPKLLQKLIRIAAC